MHGERGESDSATALPAAAVAESSGRWRRSAKHAAVNSTARRHLIAVYFVFQECEGRNSGSEGKGSKQAGSIIGSQRIGVFL